MQVALGYDYLKNKLQLAAPRLSDSANGEPQREASKASVSVIPVVFFGEQQAHDLYMSGMPLIVQVSAEVSEAFRRYQMICEEQPALLQEYISVVAQMVRLRQCCCT